MPGRLRIVLPGGISIAAGLVWLVSRQRHFSGWVDDDAFISFRYARNWAEGHGLVFNPGERVEGFTNFLWTAILALAHHMHLDLPATAQVLGGFIAASTVLLLVFGTGRILRADDPAPSASVRLSLLLLPAVALCLMESWSAWSVGGLENVLSGFLVTAALMLYVSWLGRRDQTRPLLVSCAALLCLAVLNHPTNGIFATVIGIHLLATVRSRSLRFGAWMPFFALQVFVLGMFLLARYFYYGDLLPNTWYAKGGMSLAVWQRGGRYLVQILLAHPLPYLLTVIVLVGVLRRRPIQPALRLMASSIMIMSLYIVAVGGEEFPAYRATVVLLPMFCLLLAGALLQWPRHRPWEAATPIVAIVLLLAATLPLALNERVRRLDIAIAEGRTDLSRTAAAILKSRLPPDTLFAHSGAGLIAYYTNFRWVDTLGLCDAHIARTKVDDLGHGAAGHEKGDGRYVWSRQPDYIMFPGYPISDRMPGTRTGRELWAIPEFHRRYRPLRIGFTFQSPTDTRPQQHSLFLYQKVETPTQR